MKEIYDLLAKRDEMIQAAHLAKEAGLLGGIPGMLWRNKGKLLGGAVTGLTIAGDAAKTSDIATDIQRAVARAPRNVGPIY